MDSTGNCEKSFPRQFIVFPSKFRKFSPNCNFVTRIHYVRKQKTMNRLIFLLIALPGIALMTSSCNSPENGEGTDNDSTQVENDTAGLDYSTMEYEPFAHEVAECEELGPYEFCFTGFNFINVGDTLAWKDLAIPGGMVKDTVFESINFDSAGNDTTSWVVRMIDEPDGRVYLESDFESNWNLFRFRVENPKYVLKPFDLRVGMTIGDVKAKFPNLYVGPLPEFKKIEVYPSNRLFFLIDDEGYLSEATGLPSIEAIPDDAVITGIVVM